MKIFLYNISSVKTHNFSFLNVNLKYIYYEVYFKNLINQRQLFENNLTISEKNYKLTNIAIKNFLILILEQIKKVYNNDKNELCYYLKNIYKIFFYFLNIIKHKKIFYNSTYTKVLIENTRKEKIVLTTNYFERLIKYIINVKVLTSNIVINISDVKGTVYYTCSAGLLKFKGSNKTKNLALKMLLKKIIYKLKFLNIKILAIHFKGIKKNRKKILKELKKTNNPIICLKFNNLTPHNGCRPKKHVRK